MLSGCGELRLPQWGGDKSVLIDYVPAVHQLLQERIGMVVQSYIQRKEYTAACLSTMGRAVLEYDTKDFKTLAFFFEVQGFSFISRRELAIHFLVSYLRCSYFSDFIRQFPNRAAYLDSSVSLSSPSRDSMFKYDQRLPVQPSLEC